MGLEKLDMSIFSSQNFFLEVARGNVSGMSAINKYGRNTSINNGVTADIWDGGATGGTLIWVAPTVAATHTIASTSASDDGPSGVGARTIRIFGLPDWDTAEVSEDITMDGAGANAQVTSNSYVIIYRMKVLTNGGTNINVGIITATADAPSAATVTAQINASQGQTHMAIYGVPSTQKAFIGSFYTNMNKSGGAAGNIDLTLLSNPEPDAELLNFLSKHTVGMITTGSSGFNHDYYTPKLIEGPAIIKIQALSGTNAMDVSSGFDLIIVNN